MEKKEPLISVIVIGRNEGSRLKSCFSSIFSMSFPKENYEVIYVDSGSTDQSVAIARTFPIQVIETKPLKPTAARARNEGAKVARGQFFLFLDGDTMLDPEFVKSALPYFSDLQIAVICGNREESDLQGSTFHRIFNLDWNPPSGDILSCGGDALFRSEAFRGVSGFDDDLQAGEEPDLCRRLRGEGWKIRGLDIPMTTHDLNMHHFGQYWRRSIRTGYAYAEVSARYTQTKDPLWKKESYHNVLKIFSYLIFLLITAIAVYKWGPLYILILPLIIALFVAKTTLDAYKKCHDLRLSLIYGIHSHFQHIPIFIGQMKFWLKQSKLSNYKN